MLQTIQQKIQERLQEAANKDLKIKFDVMCRWGYVPKDMSYTHERYQRQYDPHDFIDEYTYYYHSQMVLKTTTFFGSDGPESYIFYRPGTWERGLDDLFHKAQRKDEEYKLMLRDRERLEEWERKEKEHKLWGFDR